MRPLLMACSAGADARGMVALLEKKYQEDLVGYGITGKAEAILLYVNPKTRTFTILRRSGETCSVASGVAWDFQRPRGEEY